MTHQLIEIKQLERSPLNVRKTDSSAALEELKASLLAHGLMQNLVVIPAKKGKYQVIAGGRRLEALCELRDEGKLPDDHAVQCQVVDKEQAVELSLAENTVRHAMHPADEFEAFADLIGKGQTASQVAQRFGVDEKHVLKRLKLGRVAPSILAAYRAEEISLESLEAYAVTDDQKRQVSVFKSLQGWQRNNARHIRGCLTDKMVESDDKLAVFVGLEAYTEAGGKVVPDLFEDTSYLEDGALLQQLAGQKLAAAADEVKAEGWGWVEASLENDYSVTSRCSRIRPVALNAPAELVEQQSKLKAEIDELDEAIDAAWEADNEDEADQLNQQRDEAQERLLLIEEQLDDFLAFDPEQKKLAGCYVTLSHDGELRAERGLVRPEDKRKVTDESADTGGEEVKPKEKPLYGQTLHNDLAAYRLAAARVEIATHRDIAFDLLAFTLTRSHLGKPVTRGVEGRLTTQYPKPKIGGIEEQRLEEVRANLSLAWLDESTEAEQFKVFQQLTLTDKLDLLAFCTAKSLQPQLCLEGKPGSDTAFEEALSQTGGDVAAYWRPNAQNFLNRIGREQLIDIARATIGAPLGLHSLMKAKKAELVKQLDTAFSNPEKHAEGIAAKLRSWLPVGMAFRPRREAEAENENLAA